MEPVEYVFRIDVFTPQTMPLRRLGEYLTELAKMFGETEHTHFLKVTEGSAKLHATVDTVSAPKVATRLTGVAIGEAPKEALSALRSIDDMLLNDNAIATLTEAETNVVVLAFEGRNRPRDLSFPAITEETFIDGQLVSIGGRDKTAHALLQDAGHVHSNISMSRDVARELAPLLYGPTLRLFGTGRFVRQDDGEWKMLSFDTNRYERLLEESLLDTIEGVRAIPGNGLMQADAIKDLWDLEDDGDNDS